MIVKQHLNALKEAVKFLEETLDGRIGVSAEGVRHLTEISIKAKQALKLLKPLTVAEQNTLLWMYDSSLHWRGGMMPDEWPEYDEWLKQGRDVLVKLGVPAGTLEVPDAPRSAGGATGDVSLSEDQREARVRDESTRDRLPRGPRTPAVPDAARAPRRRKKPRP